MMENLLELQNRNKLAELMNDHIVPGKIFFKELKGGDNLTTVNGRKLQVSDGKVSIGETTIVANLVKISNVVIHSTDTIMV